MRLTCPKRDNWRNYGDFFAEKMLPAPPLIPGIEGSGLRPFWSVMIPTYNARAHYLEETLTSVLQQDPGRRQMQIEVVDDCSLDGAPVEMVHRIAGDRVAVYGEPRNNGLAAVWNRCIERARGNWIHILHQDDFVLPGFYIAMQKGTGDSRVGALFCRYAEINPDGHWIRISHLHRGSAGLPDAWLEKIAVHQLIQCPAIVVRRSVYEELGGFRPQLRYTLDWEMWQRIAAILACYRVHPASTTSKLRLGAEDLREVRSIIKMSRSYHRPNRASQLARQSRAFYAGLGVENSPAVLVQAHAGAARRQVIEALRTSRSITVLWKVGSFLILWARIVRARLKRRFQSALSRISQTQRKAKTESQSAK
jgi:glycosyltransferase involved in cell wall biosynthesis